MGPARRRHGAHVRAGRAVPGRDRPPLQDQRPDRDESAHAARHRLRGPQAQPQVLQNKQGALAEYEADPKRCPCGEAIPYEFRHTRQFCSPKCRSERQAKRQKDPTNHVTFNCLNCDNEVTRSRNYGNGHNKYCSNACANKHNKTKRHYGVDGLEIVFDSGYEALFWGLCMLLKVPVERYDRRRGVEWRPGLWYAPDFYMPTLNFAVELKGVLDDEDPERWDAFREEQGSLIVLTEDRLRKMVGDRGEFMKAMLV
jgi:hypothetical protein